MSEKLVPLLLFISMTAFWIFVLVMLPKVFLIAVGFVIFVALCVQLWRGVTDKEYYDRSGWS